MTSVDLCLAIVAYKPDLVVLDRVIASLPGTEVLLYDNSDKDAARSLMSQYGNLTYFWDGTNIGIAAAQNFLIRQAIAKGFAYAILSDQDTMYPPLYKEKIVAGFAIADDVVATFPNWYNSNAREDESNRHFLLKNGRQLRAVRVNAGLTEIAHSIASGMTIKLATFEQVGAFNEKLFIDWVDNEWCWRANQRGFKLILDPQVRIQHCLGETAVTIFGRPFTKRSTIRNYYIVRNAMYLLLRERSLLPSIKAYLAAKVLQHSAFSLVAADKKVVELKGLLAALRDAFCSRMGRRDLDAR